LDSGELKLFIFSALTIHATPGVDRIIVLTTSLKSGTRSGIFASLGIASATLIHAVIVSVSISYLINESSFPFDIVRKSGLYFLLAIGIYLMVKSFSYKLSTEISDYKRQGFIGGFIVHFINPLAIIFIISFIPQFIHKDENFNYQFIALSLMSNFIGLSMNIVTSILIGQFQSEAYRNKNLIRIVYLVAGAILFYLASPLFLPVFSK
jgi:threonine/homoserine/homoserine lactone efflux protein